ncbi:MAG TPA: hypothetical protein VEK79_03600 [Thermoanaerobaculia bacterium]|nr:hypothetical protein [Thermoanaerobaculia bacterium]
MAIAEKTVLYELPGMDDVLVQRDVAYRGDLTMDVYRSETTGSQPVVVLVAGYPDPGFARMVGCRFKDMGSTVSWARLIAASGMTAIAYTNTDPRADLLHLLEHLDTDRIALWASSGNAPLALSAVIDAKPRVKCAALCYPFVLDTDGCTDVADAATAFRFTNPQASFNDLPHDVPLFFARAGRDETPHLNAALDRFIARALAANLPITVANHPNEPHAFDLIDRGQATAALVEHLLSWLRRNV